MFLISPLGFVTTVNFKNVEVFLFTTIFIITYLFKPFVSKEKNYCKKNYNYYVFQFIL